VDGRYVVLDTEDGKKTSMTHMCRALWKGITGQQWVDHNPRTAEDHDAFWLRDYGIAKTRMIKKLGEGIVPTDASWLEIGSSLGAHLGCVRACGWSDLTGIDLCYEAVEDAADPYNRIVADGQKIPFPDDEFDVSTSSGTLMLVGGPEVGLYNVVKEMARVTRKHIMIFEPYYTKLQINIHDIKDRPFPPSLVIPWDEYFKMVLPDWEMVAGEVLPSQKDTDGDYFWFPMCAMLFQKS
jgi:hypothetical protein